jgi:hypothetical protein
MLVGPVLGTLFYASIIPISFARISSPWLTTLVSVRPEVRPDIVLLFKGAGAGQHRVHGALYGGRQMGA